MRSGVSVCVLAALSLLYGVAELVPGRFIATDEVFFKAAGRNWAATGRFAAPEIIGRLQSGPPLTEVYFAQPPVYTFLFGLYTKAAGFGPRRCILFDVLIHLLLAWTGAICARKIFGISWNLSSLCGILFLPLGTAGRPDELAIVFALWAAMALRSTKIFGGALLGLCAATSLSAIVFLGPLVVWEFLFVRESTSQDFRSFSSIFAGAATAAAACILPILLRHPSAYEQLIIHVGVQSRVLGAVTGVAQNTAKPSWPLWSEFLCPWRDAMTYGVGYVCLILGIFAFACALRAAGAKGPAARYDRFAVAAILFVLLAIVLPGKYLYLWYCSAWLLLASVALAANFVPRLAPFWRTAILGLGICMWMIAAAPYARGRAILWMLPTDQSLSASVAKLRNLVPPGARVLTTDFWWALADRDVVYDALFSDPPSNELDYAVLSGNGSGTPGVPLIPNGALFYAANFKPVYNGLNPSPLAVFGIPLSHSAYGFGAYVLKRSPPHSTR